MKERREAYEGSIALKQRQVGKLESGGRRCWRDGKSKEKILEMEEEK